MRTKLVCFFNGDMRHHQAVVMRACIAMKFLYGDNVHVIVISDFPEYLQVAASPYHMETLISVVSPQNTKLMRLEGSKAVFGSPNAPEIDQAKTLGAEICILPTYSKTNIRGGSLIYGNAFSYPNLRAIRDLLPPDIRPQSRKGAILE